MKQIITYGLLFLAVLAISFGFSNKEEEGQVHFKVTKEENGEKTVFEKVYVDMEALKADEELMAFDTMVSDWIDNHSKAIIIKKRIANDKDLTRIKEDTDEVLNHVSSNKKGYEDEIIEVKGEKIIKITTDGEEKVFTVTSEGEGEYKMVWIDEEGSKTELKEKHEESGKVHKEIEVIVSRDVEEKKNIVIEKRDADDMAEIKVEVEKEVDEDGNEVIREKKIWITKDGKKEELDGENSFEFKTNEDHLTIIVDDKTIDIDEFSEGEPEGKNIMILKTKDESDEGVKQTMNINIEEKDGKKFIEIDIKRDASLNVTISEIRNDDAEFQDIKMNFKNNLNPSQLRYYPNPNSGQFNLNFQLDSKEVVTVKVMDILGNEVYKEKLMDFNGIYDNEINLMGREKGIYILQISQKKKALTRKILIE